MPIKITLAKKTEQIDAILKLRYKLLPDSGVNHEGRNIHRFDAYPSTWHFIVEDEKGVIGSLRICMNSSIGMPILVPANILEQLPQPHKIMSCDMYCVAENKYIPKISRGLLLMACYVAIKYKVTHLITPINPALINLSKKLELLRKENQQQELKTEIARVPIITAPAIIEIAALKDFFIDFVKLNQLENFLGLFECIFYEEGEYIIRAGEKGDCAYILIEGEANVIHPKKYRMVNILKPGDIFGEIALLETGIRTANVIAKKQVRVMRLNKSAFMDYLLENPEKAVALMAKINELVKRTSD